MQGHNFTRTDKSYSKKLEINPGQNTIFNYPDYSSQQTIVPDEFGLFIEKYMDLNIRFKYSRKQNGRTRNIILI